MTALKRRQAVTAQPEPEGGGTNVQAAMDWLFMVLTGPLVKPPPGAVSADPGYYGGGTPNMKGLYAVCWYVYALFAGTALAGSLEIARKRLLAFLRAVPHGHSEPTTATHSQLWAALVSMSIWAAHKVGDNEVLDAAVAWKSAEYALWKPCRTVIAGVPDYWMPGARAEGPDGKLLGSNPARTLEGELIRAYDPDSESWLKGKIRVPKNKYYVGPLALLGCPGKVVGRIQEAPKPEEMPTLWCGFHVQRWESGDFIARYDDGLLKPAKGEAPAHAAGVLNGEKWIETTAYDKRPWSPYPSSKQVVVLNVPGLARER